MEIEVEKKRKREEVLKEVKEPVKKPCDPNLRELPSVIRPLVKKGSEEYMVKGDGPCLLRTVAVYTTGDEDEGPQLARDLNTHLSNYIDYYEDKLSADFPLTVTIGVKGDIRIFEHSSD